MNAHTYSTHTHTHTLTHECTLTTHTHMYGCMVHTRVHAHSFLTDTVHSYTWMHRWIVIHSHAHKHSPQTAAVDVSCFFLCPPNLFFTLLQSGLQNNPPSPLSFSLSPMVHGRQNHPLSLSLSLSHIYPHSEVVARASVCMTTCSRHHPPFTYMCLMNIKLGKTEDQYCCSGPCVRPCHTMARHRPILWDLW